MADKYSSFNDLLGEEKEGIDFVTLALDRKSSTLVVAPHGGGIEPGTSEVAAAIAGRSLSLFTFKGIKARHNQELHITSTHFDEPRCVALAKRSIVVVTIHGEGSQDKAIFLGGRHKHLLARISRNLQAFGFVVRDDASEALTGRHRANICNMGKCGAGVQVELSAGTRKSFFRSLSCNGRKYRTRRFRDFVCAVKQAILEMLIDGGIG